MKVGYPAPVPMNTAWKPISVSRSSTVNSRPTSVLHSNLIPSCRSFSISASITSFGRRKSGIPYLRTPPGSWKTSYTVTSHPAFAMSAAQAMPAGPEPTIATRKPLGSM